MFLNVPFDAAYESLFVALVGTLTCIGMKPHCVLEVNETGEGRLARIFDLMRTCRTSIHDLTRVGAPARFNMPFELGLACALRLMEPAEYELVVFDAKPFRLDRTLSDYKGRDPLIHHNRVTGIVSCIYDAFQNLSGPRVRDIRQALRSLETSAREAKHEFGTSSLFRPAIFRSLVADATNIALQRGFIPLQAP